jgi:hypothetical protein
MIYVDESIYPFRGQMYCHLFTDGDTEALHEFAQSIGLKREWFQDRKGFPHYDLAPSKRAAAVKRGAVEVSAERMVAIVRGRAHGAGA